MWCISSTDNSTGGAIEDITIEGFVSILYECDDETKVENKEDELCCEWGDGIWAVVECVRYEGLVISVGTWLYGKAW